jgi:hypothetical protein
MPDDAIQVELGGDDHPVRSSASGGGKAVWLIVGIALGFAFSLLFSSSLDRVPVASGDTTTTTAAPALGIGAAIADFPDGLNVLISPGEGRALEVLTWPLQGEPFYRSVPLGDIDLAATAHFDASGQFLAATTSTPDGLTLRSGRPNTFGVMATGVTGFAWHDSESADLAWSKVDDDEFQIWVSDDAGQGELVVRAIGIGEGLSAFGDWGFAIAERTGVTATPQAFRTHLLAPSGDLRGVIDGWVVASHGSGLLLVTDADGNSIVTTDNIETQFELTRDELETLFDFEDSFPSALPVLGAKFSPDGQGVAMTFLVGLAVVQFGDVVEVETFPIRAGSDSISWSSDGRFVLVSTFRGVAVLDTQTGEIGSILDSETTRSVAATPIGGP